MTDDANLNRSIGRLEGKLEGISQQISALGESSALGRKAIYERIEKSDEAQADMNQRLHMVERDVRIVKPLAQDYGKIKQRAIGLAIGILMVWTVVGALVLAAVQAGLQWAGWWPNAG